MVNDDSRLTSSVIQDDIADFLDRVNIVGGHRGIIITMDDRGRPSGDAYVEVESVDDVDLALKMNRRDMGSRWVGEGSDLWVGDWGGGENQQELDSCHGT